MVTLTGTGIVWIFTHGFSARTGNPLLRPAGLLKILYFGAATGFGAGAACGSDRFEVVRRPREFAPNCVAGVHPDEGAAA